MLGQKFIIPTVAVFLISTNTAGIAGRRVTGPDSGLYAAYRIAASEVSLSVCGRLESTSGCYSTINLDGFESACAVLTDDATVNGNVVNQQFYILDKRNIRSGADPLNLYVYTRTDTITDSADKVVVTLRSKVQMPFGSVGGSAAHCSLASNGMSIFAATDIDSSDVYVVNKSSLQITSLGTGSAKSITSDARGFVFVALKGHQQVVIGPDSVIQATFSPHYVLIDSANAHIKNKK